MSVNVINHLMLVNIETMKTVNVVDKLVEECTETVEEVKLAKIISAEDENKNKCSSSRLYIMLFSIIFTVNVGIGTYFVCFHWFKQNKAIVDLKERTLY